MSGDDPRVVILSGTVETGSDELEINNNKTLIGADANARIIGGIGIRGNNIIIRNLTVQGMGQGNSPSDAMYSQGASNLWLDHLNVYDGGDGIMDLVNGSDLATVSWCKFWYTDSGHSHRLALLFGNGSEKCDVDAGHQNHTLHHNWFAELVDQRMPRLLFGQGHIFNNYYNSPGNSYCIGSGSWSSLLVENNYFQDVNDPHRFQDSHPSYIAASGNVYDNTDGDQDTGLGGSEGPSNDCENGLGTPGPWTPPYAYSLDPAESIPDLVMRCAGPQ
jgi:pectate lyase